MLRRKTSTAGVLYWRYSTEGENAMNKQHLSAYVKEFGLDRTLTAYASTGDVDRDREAILPSAWDNTIEAFRKNAVLLWAHDYRIPPVGKVSDLQVDEHGLRFTAQFATTDFAGEVWELYREGFLNAFSVGFRPLKYESVDDDGDGEQPIRLFTECELLEISAVPVPANPHALIERGVPTVTLKGVVGFGNVPESNEKRAIPYTETPVAPEGMEWDASAARRRIREWADGDIGKYRKAFVWQRPGEPVENLSTYAGIHHDILEGQLRVVWRGVAAAMASLVFGARGGRIEDDDERKAVYDHLRREYKNFDKPVPEFRDYDEAELKHVFPSLNEASNEPSNTDDNEDDTSNNLLDRDDDNDTLSVAEETALYEGIGQWLENLVDIL